MPVEPLRVAFARTKWATVGHKLLCRFGAGIHFAFVLCIGPLQFNYLSYELFLEKKSCQTPKKKKKKVTFGVLSTKVVLKFSLRLQKKKKKKCKF